jgi:hypothetical protein
VTEIVLIGAGTVPAQDGGRVGKRRHSMRHLAITVTALSLVLTSACIQQQEEHPIKQVLPTAENVKIHVPEAQQSSQGYALGDLADYYVITRTVSRNLNAGAAWVLILVHAIVQYPPTSRDGATYTWGPWSNALEPAEWRLTVTERADGSYDWAFDGRSKIGAGTDFETVISGNAVPGAEPHHGSGTFLIDFDAAERVNPVDNDNRGSVEIAYDLENRDGTPATLTMAIDSVQADETGTEQPVHFDYHYAENADQSGNLVFGIHGDLDENGGTKFEDATIRSRWNANGAGRADVEASGGDLGTLNVTASECWSESFLRVYYSDSQEWQPTEGDPNDCAFADQSLPGA